MYKRDECFSTIQKLKTIRSESKITQVKIFEFSYIHELTLYSDNAEFRKGIEIIPQIEAGLDQFKKDISDAYKINFYHNITYLYFGNGDYSQSLQWSNKILNYPNQSVFKDVHSFARILNLIIHYELGNESLLEYLDKSVHRYLDTRNRLYKTETAVVNFFRLKLPKLGMQKELIEAFQELKSKIEEITKDPFEKKALEYFDFISWLESKIENRPFAEILREKIKLDS